MDERVVVERAEVIEHPTDLYPGSDDGPQWLAEDPETGCRGFGEFEQEARTNLVHAVKAYRTEGSDVGYVSFGRARTYEMAWLRDDGIVEKVREVLPF